MSTPVPASPAPFVLPDPVRPRARYAAVVSGARAVSVEIIRLHEPLEFPAGEPFASLIWHHSDAGLTGPGAPSIKDARELGDVVARYDRNYSMLRTFEPFRQGHKEYALVSREYVRTEVIDLSSGEVVAQEPYPRDDTDTERPGWGFCPVEFYCPDWWDVADGSIVPGSQYWDASDEWLTGQFALVSGCHWGDDCGWKVQYLVLSRIEEGIITRDDRFGYVTLPGGLALHEAASIEPESRAVRLAVELGFSLDTGAPDPYALEGITGAKSRKFVRPGESS